MVRMDVRTEVGIAAMRKGLRASGRFMKAEDRENFSHKATRSNNKRSFTPWSRVLKQRVLMLCPT